MNEAENLTLFSVGSKCRSEDRIDGAAAVYLPTGSRKRAAKFLTSLFNLLVRKAEHFRTMPIQ